MRSTKYTRLPTEDNVDHQVIEMSYDDSFDFGSIYSYEGKSQPNKYGSVFSYGSSNNRSKTDIQIQDVESKPSLFGTIFSPIITLASYILMVLTFPISAWFVFKMVKEYERLVIFRVGKLKRVKGPGLTLILPCVDRITKVDVRTKAFSVPPLKAMTSDGATVEMGAEVYYQVCDPVKSVSCIQDVQVSTRSLCQLVLQNMMPRFSLMQCQGDQAGITNIFKSELNITTAEWGLMISKVQLSPVKVISDPNVLLEGCNLASAPLDCLGPMLFPPGTTQMPIQPLKERGLLPAGGANDVLGDVLNQMIGGFAQVAAQRQRANVVCGEAPTTNTGVPPLPAVIPSTSAATAPGAVSSVKASFTPRELLQLVQPHITSDLVNQVKAVFLFKVNGDQGGDFFLDLKNGSGRVGEGLPPGGTPDVTLTLSRGDIEKIFLGQLSAFQAYVGGRLKIDGDLHLAMALQAVVETMQTTS